MVSVGVVVSVIARKSLDKSELQKLGWVDVFKSDSKPKFVTFFHYIR